MHSVVYNETMMMMIRRWGSRGGGGGVLLLYMRVRIHGVAFCVSEELYPEFVYVFLKYCALLSSTYLAAKMLTSNAKIFTIYNNVRRV